MTSEREKRIKILRRDLEGWREILVVLHSVLIWEKHFYPAITASIISSFFLLIWFIDPAVLLFVSIIGLLFTISDALVPIAISYIYGPDHWTGTHERKYEQIITTLAGTCETISNFWTSVQDIKNSKPKTYFIIVTTFLIIFAWIGSSVNNLFLTYLIVLLAALYPGLRRQGIVNQYFAMFMQKVAQKLKGTPAGSNNGGSKDRTTKRD